MSDKKYGSIADTAAQPRPQPSPDDFLRQGREIGVLVPILQNLMGALAVMLLIATAATVVWGATQKPGNPLLLLEHFARAGAGAGLVCGMIVFCLATIIRMFRDEVLAVVASWSKAKERTQVQALRIEIKHLTDELAELRSNEAVNERYSVLAAVEKIIAAAFSAQTQSERRSRTSRAALAEGPQRVMSRTEWELALKLMSDAGVLANGKLTVDSPAVALARVVEFQQTHKRYVKSADGSWAQV